MGKLVDFDFGYDQKSIAWLAGYIDRQRTRSEVDESLVLALINTIGSYLGEAIIVNYGGEWHVDDDDEWACVLFSDGNIAYPFAKVTKHFQNGADDSIEGFFTVIPQVFQNLGVNRHESNEE